MLMPIGRFAKASRLSIKSLRNYDASGLLPAALVDPISGYRYYRLEQLARAIRIRSLRMVELPLSQIAEILDSADPEQLLASHLATLHALRAEYDHKIHELTRLISAKELTMTNEVTIKKAPSRTVAAVRTATTPQSVFVDIPAGFAHVLTFLAGIGETPIDAPFTLFHQFPEPDGAGDISLCVPIDHPVGPGPGIDIVTIPGAAVSSILHVGPYADMAESYATIAAWIHERGHRILGPSREIYLNNPTDVAETELLTEIQWPIDTENLELEPMPQE
jgi:effector-binding domain-containing protein